MLKVRPYLATVGISILLIACVREDRRPSMVAANIDAIQEARSMQSLLARTQECPDKITGWTRTDEYEPFEKATATEGLRFPIRFECRDDLSFTVWVKYDMDSGTIVSAQNGTLKIRYGHFTDSRTLEILPSDDPAKVAARVVDERW
jgi:hypothetical protein